MALLLFVTIFPFWWMVRTALTASEAVFLDTTSLLPVQATLINFQRVLGPGRSADSNCARRFGPVDQLCAARFQLDCCVHPGRPGQTTFSAMAAYAFARLRFPFRDGSLPSTSRR
jgi:multiple sugar transport system permease protein